MVINCENCVGYRLKNLNISVGALGVDPDHPSTIIRNNMPCGSFSGPGVAGGMNEIVCLKV